MRLQSAGEAVTEAQRQLVPTLGAIEALHEMLVTAPSWPRWLGENLVQSLSHARNSQLNRQLEWRQFESFACNNVDSIHNDFQRHKMYISLPIDHQCAHLFLLTDCLHSD